MKNTDLFDFDFNNHEKEVEALDMILEQKYKMSNIIWIDGDSGAGKTFFLQHNVVKAKSDIYKIFVTEKVGKEESKSYISAFAEILDEKQKKGPFYNYLKNNYNGITDVVKKMKDTILPICGITDFGALDIALDITKKFVSKDNEEHNYSKVIINYLDKVIKKQDVVVILDNFTLCDSESLEIIAELLYYYSDNSHIFFILVTTHEILETRTDIVALISEKIDVERINIKPFSDLSYFISILENIYDLDACNNHDLLELFNICKGYPQKLKTFLINLYTKDGIQFDGEKAVIIQDSFRELLIQELIDFDYEHLTVEEKYILQVIATWGTPINEEVIKKFISYLSGEGGAWEKLTRAIVSDVLIKFENIGVLEYLYQNDDLSYIKFKHDSLYNATYEFLKTKTVNFRFLHSSMYQFISVNKQLFSNTQLAFLLSYHSYNSKVNNWMEINYSYGLDLIEKRHYVTGQKIFDRVIEDLETLSIKQKLIIAENCYNVGQYEKSKSILEQVPLNINTFTHNYQQTIDYFITRTKVSHILFEYDNAIQELNQVLKDAQILESDRITFLYFKFSALCMVPSGFNRALKLFNKTIKVYDEQPAMIKVYKSAMDYYKGEKCLKFLKKGLSIAEQIGDQEEVAMLKHNIGFEYFRCGEYEQSEYYINQSLLGLEQYKIHETSYCLNNLAAIQIAKNEWLQALSLLNKALFRNKSKYAKIAIKGNMMVCYHELGNHKLCNKLMLELQTFLENNNNIDDKLYKKIYTNIAIIYFNKNDIKQAKQYLTQALPYIKTISKDSSARVKKYIARIENTPYKLKSNKYRAYYYTLPYEPWLITFGHQ